jgi:aspartyl protease family protein
MLRDISIAAVVVVFGAVTGVNYLQGKAERERNAATQAAAEPLTVSDEPAVAAALQRPQSSGAPGLVELPSDGRGHFEAMLEVEGTRFKALVDTGATVIALPQSVAELLGIHPAAGDFTETVSTANGEVKVAPVILREVRLASISVRDVEAVVIPDASLKQTLLGMSFLKRLKSFAINGDQLTLRN